MLGVVQVCRALTSSAEEHRIDLLHVSLILSGGPCVNRLSAHRSRNDLFAVFLSYDVHLFLNLSAFLAISKASYSLARTERLATVRSSLGVCFPAHSTPRAFSNTHAKLPPNGRHRDLSRSREHLNLCWKVDQCLGWRKARLFESLICSLALGTSRPIAHSSDLPASFLGSQSCT
ncbi:hypothetical protein NMY22_g14485 [Coprinellus aureogranulatus]|nr:hypothetical protein NMY22_g14485 [Coprinellus aureogranulatus]